MGKKHRSGRLNVYIHGEELANDVFQAMGRAGLIDVVGKRPVELAEDGVVVQWANGMYSVAFEGRQPINLASDLLYKRFKPFLIPAKHAFLLLEPEGKAA